MRSDDDTSADWSDAELSVLRSAELDRPAADAVDRTLAGLGVGAGLVTVAALSKGATLGGLLRSSLWVKWLGVALLGGGIAGSVLVSQERAQNGAAPAVASANGARGFTRVEKRAPENAAPAGSSVALSAPEAPTVAVPAAVSGRAPVQNRNTALEQKPHEEALSAEIQAIDGARQRVRRGDWQGALAALDRYSQMVGRGGSLRAEATIVRIEALQASGDARGASALAERFLAKNRSSAYADYVRRILAQSK
jgi:hypothetical protein